MTLRLRLLVPLAVVLLTGCSIELQHDLPEQDANDVYILLTKNGIAAKKERQEGGDTPMYMITVPKQDATQAAEMLKQHSLPRPRTDGLEIFIKNKGMVPTQTEERAMLLQALGGEVARALNQVDGVLSVQAIVMIPENNDLTQAENRPKPSASVLVRYRNTTDEQPPVSEDLVRRFVASAVPEMSPDKVTVLLSQSTPPAADVTPENRLQDVLGLRMTAASATQFKLMVGLTALVMLGMAGFTTFTVLRAGGSAKPPRRPRQEA